MSIASTAAVANLNAADAINQLAGIASDIPLAALRAQRPELVRYAEGS